MKYFPPALIAALIMVLVSPTQASAYNFSNSIDTIKNPLICADEEEKKKKKKKGAEEEEPDCD